MAAEDKGEEKPKLDELEAVAVPIDSRIMWFEEKVCSALKLKVDKFKKLISNGAFV